MEQSILLARVRLSERILKACCNDSEYLHALIWEGFKGVKSLSREELLSLGINARELYE